MSNLSSITEKALDSYISMAIDGAYGVKKRDPSSQVDTSLVKATISREVYIRDGRVYYREGFNTKSAPSSTDPSAVFGFASLTRQNVANLSNQIWGTNLKSYDQQVETLANDPMRSISLAAEYLRQEEQAIKALLNNNHIIYNSNDLRGMIAGSYNLGRGVNNQAILASVGSDNKFDLNAYTINYHNSLKPGDLGNDNGLNNTNRILVAANQTPLTSGDLDNRLKSQAVQKAKENVLQSTAEDTKITADQSFLESQFETIQKELPSLIINQNLDNTPWYGDNTLLTANPHLKQILTPAWFEINLRQYGNNRFVDSNGNPILIKLNVSLREINISQAHIMDSKPTRSGFHITMWGQEPDTIAASGTTGLFMNFFGVTHLMSSKGKASTSELYNKMVDAFANPDGATEQLAILNKEQNPLRVAAQDAFVEMLSLFKNNGVTRFHPEIIKSVFANKNPNGKQMVSEASWSPAIGGTNIQASNRNNDVLTRGYVIFRYKNRSFLGYFKSIDFTMDANNPFKWDFSFVFQVEKSIRISYYPPF